MLCMNVTILYEDQEMLVLDKPSGMTVNRADTTRGVETLQDWIDENNKVPRVSNVPKVSKEDEKTSGTFDTSDTFNQRSGIVHRLDKETSGLLLVAKNEQAFFALQSQFKERTVRKKYLTLVHGEVKPSEGEINVPIGRQEWNRMRFGVVAGGKEAVTLYTVLEYRKLHKTKETVSYLEIELKTGRTHQIRVHMKYLGYPLFADFLYAGRKTQRDDRKYLSRVFLHAAKISFIHPKTEKEMQFTSVLPEELQSFLNEQTDVV